MNKESEPLGRLLNWLNQINLVTWINTELLTTNAECATVTTRATNEPNVLRDSNSTKWQSVLTRLYIDHCKTFLYVTVCDNQCTMAVCRCEYLWVWTHAGHGGRMCTFSIPHGVQAVLYPCIVSGPPYVPPNNDKNFVTTAELHHEPQRGENNIQWRHRSSGPQSHGTVSLTQDTKAICIFFCWT